MNMLHSVESAEEACYPKKLTNSNFEAEPSQGVKPATEQQPFKGFTVGTNLAYWINIFELVCGKYMGTKT